MLEQNGENIESLREHKLYGDTKVVEVVCGWKNKEVRKREIRSGMQKLVER